MKKKLLKKMIRKLKQHKSPKHEAALKKIRNVISTMVGKT